MASRKAARKRVSVSAALASGKAQAASTVAFRATQRRKRAHALTTQPTRRRAPQVREVSPRFRLALGPSGTAGVLIAEGDSWFDYPMNDVLGLLEDEHGYDVESVAHKGDRVEDMAYSAGQFEELARRLERLIRQGHIPTAILLSGGGNDIAGDAFAVLINHASSSLPSINRDVVHGVIDLRLRDAYAFLIGGLTEISRRYLGAPIPILTHGYDYPVPDGRGFLGGWGPFPGPWLQPGFLKKGRTDMNQNIAIMQDLIDAFNTMLESVGRAPGCEHVRYVNLRGTLSNGAAYRTHWANELHPTRTGFQSVTAKFAKVIATL